MGEVSLVATKSSVSDFKTWSMSRWNARLLQHFFARSAGNDEPVSILLVTPEALAQVTGDPKADGEEARDTFVETTLHSVRHENLLATAADYLGSPGLPLDDVPPPFLSYLIFTCIAAAESSDELATERSYVARLRALTRDQLPENSLPVLARLWETLVAWLDLPPNRARYRGLRLPNPGGLTRIGYTTKLSFPDRRDQRELSEVLDNEGLLGHEPPIGVVLSAVARERSRFRDGFQKAFDEFRGLYAAQRTPGLLDHRFWAAVREAAIRGRGRDDASLLGGQSAQLLAEIGDDDISLFVVTEVPVDGDGPFTSSDLPFSYGQWRYVLGDHRFGASDAQQEAVRGLLARKQRILPLSSPIEQGILPFTPSAHGLLELASIRNITEAEVVLVRKELADDLIRLASAPNVKPHPCRYDGWVQLFRPSIRRRPSTQLEGTTLNRVWMLHESVERINVVPTGGVQTEDGWLGLKEVLPRVRADNAAAVEASSSGTKIALRHDADGLWAFPLADLRGEYRVEAQFSDQCTSRTLRFVPSPTHETFKWPTDESAWIVEGVGGTLPLDRILPLRQEGISETSSFTNDIVYLGRNLGEFVNDPANAAWVITGSGELSRGRRANPELALPPDSQVGDFKLRKRWRTLLLQATPDPADGGFGAARYETRKVVQGSGLPEMPPVLIRQGGETQTHGPILPSVPSHRVERIVDAIAARANSRCGMAWREWVELAHRLLGVREHEISAVTRAWQEASLFDVAYSTRWRTRCLLAKRPQLVAFRSGELFGARLCGLTLSSTRIGVRQAAKTLRVQVLDHRSVSPFVPPTISIRATEQGQIAAVALKTGLGVVTVDVSPEGYAPATTLDPFSTPPIKYVHDGDWKNWSLSTTPSGPAFAQWVRDDQPTYWVATAGEKSAWSYDLNTVRLLACSLANVAPLRADGLNLEAVHAYLPLPLARVASIFSSVIPGPDASDGRRYLYPLSTAALRAFVESALDSAFVQSRVTGAREV